MENFPKQSSWNPREPSHLRPSLNNFGLVAAVFSVLNGCDEGSYEVPIDYGNPVTDTARFHEEDGGWTLPFPSGAYWKVTQGYETGTHTDWGFEYGDDTYALDFSRSACEAYGMAVTPIDAGSVFEVVIEGEEDQGYGNSLLLQHEGGFVSRYGHLSSIQVSVGESVDTDSKIAEVGNSGDVTGEACEEHPGTHLHMALYLNGEGVKPEPLSGRSLVSVGCWYNREGVENCSGDPGDY